MKIVTGKTNLFKLLPTILSYTNKDGQYLTLITLYFGRKYLSVKFILNKKPPNKITLFIRRIKGKILYQWLRRG